MRVTGPCRCAYHLALEMDEALRLLRSGRIGKAEKALTILRWRLAPEVETMECNEAAQLRVKMKPVSQLVAEGAER